MAWLLPCVNVRCHQVLGARLLDVADRRRYVLCRHVKQRVAAEHEVRLRTNVRPDV